MEETIVLKNAKFVETTFEDGSKQMVGVVRGDSFVGLSIPSEPNPRQFIGEANPYYKDMVKTLRLEPRMFARKNAGGITIFATGCDHNGDGSYTLTFKEGDGISNGGHTFNALKNHGTDKSQVRITIEIGLDRNKTNEIAEALNLNKRLQAYSLQNKEGSFDWHKRAIGEKASEVIYHEGDTGTVEIKEAIAFLNLFKHDSETKKLDIMTNIVRSEHANATFLKKVINESDQYDSELKWIAKDVHDITMYALHSPRFSILLKPLKHTNGHNWLKTRSSEKKVGIMKGLGLLLVAGLANEGTTVNQNGIVVWKKGFKKEEERKLFIKELFKKVFDVISVEEGSASDIIRQDSVRRKVIKHSQLITRRLQAATAAKKRKVG